MQTKHTLTHLTHLTHRVKRMKSNSEKRRIYQR